MLRRYKSREDFKWVTAEYCDVRIQEIVIFFNNNIFKNKNRKKCFPTVVREVKSNIITQSVYVRVFSVLQ